MPERRFAVRGEVDLSTAADLQARLMTHIAASTDDLVLDCEYLDFIDSMGISVFVDVHGTLDRQGRRCRIVNLRRGVRRPFDTLGLAEMLSIEELDPA